MSQNVLIIGATSAIASEVARVYAANGDQLFLIGRNAERLGTLTESLGSAVRGTASADLNDFEQHPHLIEQAFSTLNRIDRVLIAHGFLGDQIHSESDPHHALEILTTNLTSPVSLLVALVPRLQNQGSGHVAVITSVAGERGRPRNFTYGAAKGGLTRYLQGLRSTLHKSPVRIINIKLGPADTPMTVDHEKNALFGEKTSLAKAIVRALEGKRHAVYLKRIWGPIMGVVRILPEFIFQRFQFLSGR